MHKTTGEEDILPIILQIMTAKQTSARESPAAAAIKAQVFP